MFTVALSLRFAAALMSVFFKKDASTQKRTFHKSYQLCFLSVQVASIALDLATGLAQIAIILTRLLFRIGTKPGRH